MKLLFVKLIVAYLFILSFAVFAQNEMRVVGNGEFQPSELIDKSIRDANGDICAGLMIVSDFEGFAYDSYNGIVKVNRKPGEDFLFLSPDERVVTVYKTGYTPLKIVLYDFGIKLNKGEVWKLKITGDKVNGLIPINVVVTPEDVKIFVDNKEKRTNPIMLTEGEHLVKIEKEGYKKIEEKIKVSNQNTLFTFKLKTIDLEPVQIISSPEFAKIFINGSERGETNKGLFLYPGTYKLKLVKVGYTEFETDINVSPGKENKYSFNLLKNTGNLLIQIIPEWAQIFINKERFNKDNIELSEGVYQIEIKADGYESVIENISVEKGNVISKVYELKPKTGMLQVSVKPLESYVKLMNSKRVIDSWEGLKIIDDLPVGEYELEVSYPNYITEKIKLKIEENLKTEYEINLKSNPNNISNLIVKKNADEEIESLSDEIFLNNRTNIKTSLTGELGYCEGKLKESLRLKTSYGGSLIFCTRINRLHYLYFSLGYIGWRSDSTYHYLDDKNKEKSTSTFYQISVGLGDKFYFLPIFFLQGDISYFYLQGGNNGDEVNTLISKVGYTLGGGISIPLSRYSRIEFSGLYKYLNNSFNYKALNISLIF